MKGQQRWAEVGKTVKSQHGRLRGWNGEEEEGGRGKSDQFPDLHIQVHLWFFSVTLILFQQFEICEWFR